MISKVTQALFLAQALDKLGRTREGGEAMRTAGRITGYGAGVFVRGLKDFGRFCKGIADQMDRHPWFKELHEGCLEGYEAGLKYKDIDLQVVEGGQE